MRDEVACWKGIRGFVDVQVTCFCGMPWSCGVITQHRVSPNHFHHCHFLLWMYTWTILIIVQRDATENSLFIILQVHSTCFECQPHPSSGVHKTVTAASDTGHIFCATTSLQRGQAWPRWRELADQSGGCSYRFVYSWSVAYPGILFGGGVQQIQLRTEDRENGDLGAVAP